MKKQYLIEVAITMVLLVGVVLFKFLPEYRQEYGSSDSLIYTDLSRLVEIHQTRDNVRLSVTLWKKQV